MFLLFAFAALLGAAMAVLPALAAGPSEAALEVNENCHEPAWPCWALAGSSAYYPPPASRVTIAPGGEVMFTDHDASAPTTVSWMGSAPTMCSGIPASAASNWEGRCKFELPGTYRFESAGLWEGDGFNYTKYEIVVENTGTGTTSTTTTTTTTPTTTTTTPTTTTTTPTTTTPTTTTPTTTTPTTTTYTQPYGGGSSTGTVPSAAMTGGSTETSSSPAASHALATVALANAQHGDAVHGTVQIPTADGGARLEVELLARDASPARVKRSSGTRVGRLVRSSVPAGKVSFTVSLDKAAKRALRRHHKLALTVKIVLTPVHGAALTLTRNLNLR